MVLIVFGATGECAWRVVTALQQRGITVQQLDSLDGVNSLSLVSQINSGARFGNDDIVALHLGLMVPGTAVDVAELLGVREQLRAAGIDKLVLVLPAGPKGLGPEGRQDGFDTLRQDGAGTEILLLPLEAVAAGSENPANVGFGNALVDAIECSLASDTRENFYIVSNPEMPNAWFVWWKRVLDIGLSLGIVAALWWLLLIIWALVRFQSPGPGIFTQERVGRGERIFTCYKFRTMHSATPNLGTHEVSQDSVTPLGRLLRASKVDELPQLVNVLKGEMSFVGPRPCLPTQLELIERRRARGIFQMVPGITGLAQVAKVDMSDPERLADWDYRYLKLRSLRMDMTIIWQTALGKGGGDRTTTRKS